MYYRLGTKEIPRRLLGANVHFSSEEVGAHCSQPERQLVGLKAFSEQILWGNSEGVGKGPGTWAAA